MYPIEINGNKLYPTKHDKDHPGRRLFANIASSAADSNYILVQTREPLNGEQKRALKAKDVQIHEYVSDNTYLCGYKPESLDAIREDPTLKEFILYADVYQPSLVVEAGLRAGKDDDETAVEVVLHDDVGDGLDAVANDIATSANIDPSAVQLKDGRARLNVTRSSLDNIARLDAIKYIHAAPERKLFNNVAVDIMEVHKPVGLNHTVYKGKDQLVCVADTGFDTGDPNNCHAAFTGRVKLLEALGRPGRSDDTDGHGTHVCGSVLGKGMHQEQGLIEAPASEAQLMMQSVLDANDGLGGIPDAISDLFNPALKAGARIHTNSWGSDVGAYNAYSRSIDKYLHENPEMVVLFAASNSGTDAGDRKHGYVDPRSLSPEASTKNIITVGASESRRPDVEYEGISGALLWGRGWPRDYPYAPISRDAVADNPEGLAAFSSRGPTIGPGARIKPDVVAPGTTILSARSSKIDPTKFNEGWGISTDKNWMYEGGTSMATPLVAGCCAVVRGALQDSGVAPNPSAALIKAVIINGAVPLKGQYTPVEFGPAPNSDYGFGRVNVANSLHHVAGQEDGTAGCGDGKRPLDDDGTHDKEFSLPIRVPHAAGTSGRLTLKVTLVWNDPEGARLQNDLDLIVSNASSEKHGNMGNGTGFDRVNNIEQVVWEDVKAGEEYKMNIRVYRTTQGPQSFAYAWRIFASS